MATHIWMLKPTQARADKLSYIRQCALEHYEIQHMEPDEIRIRVFAAKELEERAQQGTCAGSAIEDGGEAGKVFGMRIERMINAQGYLDAFNAHAHLMGLPIVSATLPAFIPHQWIDQRWITSTVVDLSRILKKETTTRYISEDGIEQSLTRGPISYRLAPILADALMDAGCTHQRLLSALREVTPVQLPNCPVDPQKTYNMPYFNLPEGVWDTYHRALMTFYATRESKRWFANQRWVDKFLNAVLYDIVKR